MDEKLEKVEKSLALMAANEEERRKQEFREEFQRLNYTVQSVKETMDKNENKIGEIVMKIENLVNTDKYFLNIYNSHFTGKS